MLKTNKAMVVIDMPEACFNCQLCAQFHDELYCTALSIDDDLALIDVDDVHDKRLPNCPLIPVTEDMERYLEFYQERILPNMGIPKEMLEGGSNK